MKRRLLRRVIVVLVAHLVLSVVAGIMLAEITLHPVRRRPLAADSLSTLRDFAFGVDCNIQAATIISGDGISLRAWLVHPIHSNGNAVILLHGMSDNRLGMTGAAQLLVRNGFTVLMPDARAHGDSGGTLATFGLFERDDIRRWFEWLNAQQTPHCIYGFGESMGAAQILQSLQTETHFCAVAAESPFASFREIAYERMGQFVGTGPWIGRSLLRPAVEISFLYARWRYGLDFERASPRDAVAETKVPVLLIHGASDRNISIRHSREIQSMNPSVILWEVPGANHCGAMSMAPQQFESKLVGWFSGR
jgi:alpha-beta hydrolase superfamily lysophospholipase